MERGFTGQGPLAAYHIYLLVFKILALVVLYTHMYFKRLSSSTCRGIGPGPPQHIPKLVDNSPIPFSKALKILLQCH